MWGETAANNKHVVTIAPARFLFSLRLLIGADVLLRELQLYGDRGVFFFVAFHKPGNVGAAVEEPLGLMSHTEEI